MKRNTDYFRVEDQASPGSYITNTECCCPKLLITCDQQSGVIKITFIWLIDTSPFTNIC